MYYTTRLSPSVLRPVSLSYTTMRGHTPTMLLMTSTRDGIDISPVMMARRRLDRDIIQSRCSAPFRRVTINSVIERDPNIQKRKTTLSANIASGDVDQKWDTPLTCASTHFPNIPCTFHPTLANRQKQQPGTLNHPLQTQLTRALITRVWHQLQNGLQHSQQPDGKCPSPTSARRPTKTRHAPRTQGCRNDEPLPSQPLPTKFGATFQ